MDASVKTIAHIAVGLVTCLGATTYGQQQSDAESASRPNTVQLPSGAKGPFRPGSLQSGNANPAFRLEPVAASAPEEFEEAKVIARVGDEVILAGDMLGQVNQFLHSRMQQLTPEQRSQLDPNLLNNQRWTLIRQLLPQVIDGKLVYLDFLRTIPKERLPDLQDSLYRAFDEQQLPVLIERAKVGTAADLDQQLRSFGSSLDQQRRSFAEQLAAMQWKNRHGSSSKEITHEDMLSYYRDHREDFLIKAKARWEQLAAYDATTLSRQASREKVAKLGNEVLRGASFQAVAKRGSNGPTASKGGTYDWTNRGSLRSNTLDQAIFTLPIDRLSEILEDADGCHIVRVIERTDRSYVSFEEAQESIRKKIEAQRKREAEQEYVQKLRNKFPVWTVFDDAVASASQGIPK